MIHIEIICVGKIKETFFKDAILEYSKRLSKFCKLNIIELPDEKIPDKCSELTEVQIKQKESNNIISHIKKDSYCIALDLNGKEFSSIDLSQKLNNLSLKTSLVTFIIGGSLGLSPNVISYCDESICFSKLTFPHNLFRIILLEQIYRSFKIINNETYHK